MKRDPNSERKKLQNRRKGKEKHRRHAKKQLHTLRPAAHGGVETHGLYGCGGQSTLANGEKKNSLTGCKCPASTVIARGIASHVFALKQVARGFVSTSGAATDAPSARRRACGRPTVASTIGSVTSAATVPELLVKKRGAVCAATSDSAKRGASQAASAPPARALRHAPSIS